MFWKEKWVLLYMEENLFVDLVKYKVFEDFLYIVGEICSFEIIEEVVE